MKCNFCGKCKSVCPVYKVERKENLSPRGLMSFLEKKIDFLNNCMLCGECKSICPFDTFVAAEILNSLVGENYLKKIESEHSEIATCDSAFISMHRSLDSFVDEYSGDEQILYTNSFADAFYKKNIEELKKILKQVVEFKNSDIYFCNKTNYDFFSNYLDDYNIKFLWNEVEEYFLENGNKYFVIDSNDIIFPENIYSDKFPSSANKFFKFYKHKFDDISSQKKIITLKDNVEFLKNHGIDAIFYLDEYLKNVQA